MKLAGIISSVLAAAIACSAQSMAVEIDKLRQDLTDRNYEAAAAELRDLASSRKEYFESNDLDYLLARTQEKTGDTSAAIANFESVRRRDSVLRSYALWHLAAISRSSGNLFLERMYLTEITSFANGSLVTAAADQRLAESY